MKRAIRLIRAITSRLPQRHFHAATQVTVMPPMGECPELTGDNLRSWCKVLSNHRWRQTQRGQVGQLTFEFEHADDAMLFAKAAQHWSVRHEHYFD